jgi:hypothetical protein
MSPDSTFVENCGKQYDLPAWQAVGQDRGSTIGPVPTIDAIIALAKTKLDM